MERRGERCLDCVRSILTCPDQRVRNALLNEAQLPDSVLEMLASDPHVVIANQAKELLESQTALAVDLAALPGAGELQDAEVSPFPEADVVGDPELEAGPWPAPDYDEVTDVSLDPADALMKTRDGQPVKKPASPGRKRNIDLSDAYGPPAP